LLGMVFEWLTWNEIPCLRKVCKWWCRVISDPFLLRSFAPEFRPTESDPMANDGVIYWIVTQGNNTPSDLAQRLHLTYCPIIHSNYDFNCLVMPFDTATNKDTYFQIDEMPRHPWFSLDLRPMGLIPTHYKMKNGGGRGCVIKTWTFEGKTPNRDWEVIREHQDDLIFDTDGTNGFGTHVFEVQCKKPFTAFRVVQKNNIYCYIHRIELYGKVVLREFAFPLRPRMNGH